MRKIFLKIIDYMSVVVSFLIFMLAWFNGNLTDMPWQGTLLVMLVAGLSSLAVFSMLEQHKHQRIAIVFSVVLLLLGIPSVMQISFGSMSIGETILFYANQVYVPILGAGSLLLLLKYQQTWRVLLQWAARLYAVVGVMIGMFILYTNIPPSLPDTGLLPADLTRVFIIAFIIGMVMTIIGLIANPLYIVWRTATPKKR